MTDPQPMYDLTRDQLTTQLSFVDGLDSKLGLLLSVGSGLLGILAAVFALRAPNSPHPDFRALLVCTAAYLFLVGITGFGLWGRKWALGPEAEKVARGYNRTHPNTIKANMARKFHRDYIKNKSAYEQKVWALRLSYPLLIVQTVALVWATWSVAGL